VNEVVEDGELLERAMELAGQLAAGATGAFGLTKRLVAHSLGALESHMTLESETIASQAASVDGVEGIRAFLEKRKPDFSGNGAR
jgi:2-(1,2-epoxy-1,2-dihydrophenyl)acetyl-CoA isomerase